MLALLSACGATTRAGGPTATAAADPETCMVTVRVEDASPEDAALESADIVPRMTLTVVRICERDGTATLALPTEAGVCTPAAPERGAIAAATCWWAGAGSIVEVMREGDVLVARRTVYDEETPPGDPASIGRLDLPPDAEVATLAP